MCKFCIQLPICTSRQDRVLKGLAVTFSEERRDRVIAAQVDGESQIGYRHGTTDGIWQSTFEYATSMHGDPLDEQAQKLEAMVATRTAAMTELIGHLESAREEEKRVIARELHDDLGSSLTALSMHLAILFQKMPAEPALTDRAVLIKSLLTTIANSTRRIQNNLRPDKLDVFGIKAAIAEQAFEFEKVTGVVCKTNLPDEALAYNPQLNIVLFRVVQEALSNTARHAQASSVTIVLDDNEDEVMLTVKDNGIGIAEERLDDTTVHGLRSMRERVIYLGGSVRILGSTGNGTTITTTLPKAPVAHSNVSPDVDA